MEEEKIVKKQLIKSMVLTFITFTIIFTVFDLIIYNLVSISLYNSVDNELKNAKEQAIKIEEHPGIPEENKMLKPEENKEFNIGQREDKKQIINPRFIYILRDQNGNITNADSIGRFYDEYINNITFNKNSINTIYTTDIGQEYFYRGINFETIDENGNISYIQVLVNVDGEMQSTGNILKTLIITTIIMVLISILASYILSKRTLKPIIESLERQTEFVQNASHELRTPLAILQAKQELLLQEPDKKIIDKSRDITVCLNETRRLGKLIQELMSLARADSNKLEINKEKTNVDEFIKQITEPYIEMAKMQEKSVDLSLNTENEVNIDRNKFSELLIIILDNAIKYTEEGDKIKISTSGKDGKLNLEIADSGIGISEEALKHIFERFYREDKARSRQTGGNGLGLSIAQTIVHAHNGTIKITQNEPKGTKVIIKI